jgi:hypothetical protein
MTNGKLCPGCGKDIGVWPIFSAGLPNRIRCPYCKSRLRYVGTTSVNAVLAVASICVVAGGFTLTSSLTPITNDPIRWSLVLALLVLVAWVPVELATAWFLRNRRQLELVDHPRSEVS